MSEEEIQKALSDIENEICSYIAKGYTIKTIYITPRLASALLELSNKYINTSNIKTKRPMTLYGYKCKIARGIEFKEGYKVTTEELENILLEDEITQNIDKWVNNAIKVKYKDKELLALQTIIRKLQKENEQLKKVKEQSQEILEKIKIIYMVHTKDCELTLKDIKKWEKILDK